MDTNNPGNTGRPKLDEGSIRDRPVTIRLSRDELAQLARVVPPNKKLSPWLRTMLLRMANDNEQRNR